MMKPQDLMVGDLISMGGVIRVVTGIHDKETENGVDLITTMIPGHTFPDSNLSFRASYCYPTPLTPEILEKNGFRHEANENYVCYVGKAKIAVQFRDKVAIQVSNEFRGKDNNGRADLVSFLRDWPDVLYVHYLQHALRLCGIDRTIEL